VGEGIEGADVALDEDGEVLVPGLGGDPFHRDAGQGGGGGVAGTQGVGGDPLGGQAGGPSAGGDHPVVVLPDSRSAWMRLE